VLKDYRKKYFNDLESSVASLLIFCIYFFIIGYFFNWLIIEGVWVGDASVCKSSTGACVSFLKEKLVFILFGVYPREFLIRPILGIIILILGWLHFTKKKNWNNLLFFKFLALMFIYILLLRGFNDSFVPTSKWGGLPLTLLLSIVGIALSYPVGIFLALARTSNQLIPRYLSIIYIELIRGVPLISILFMSSVLIPLFLPDGVTINKLFRAQIAIILFSAAYFAEVIRGGLNSIPKGQWEGAKSIGLNYFQIIRLIVLPQALVKVIPPTVNTIIGMFKDTSLVIIIALFDLMGTTKASMTDSKWLGFSVEAYFLCALIYFIICSKMGKFSKKVEQELQRGH
jgi:general L-amino acid transport system permease protein